LIKEESMLEQTLSDNSLKTIERTLLSEIMKLKRDIKKFLPCNKVYHTNVINYEWTNNKILEALDSYKLIK
jgi:hypothetical protein